MISKKVLNPVCEDCGFPFVRTLKRKTKCTPCKRKEEKEYQKNYAREYQRNLRRFGRGVLS